MHGYGIVQGLQVELKSKASMRPSFRVALGFLKSDKVFCSSKPHKFSLKFHRDGIYMLWLFHVETPDEESVRPVFDTSSTEAARVVESCATRLHPIDEEHKDAIALCRIRVRMGRMSQEQWPVPRAGRQKEQRKLFKAQGQ